MSDQAKEIEKMLNELTNKYNPIQEMYNLLFQNEVIKEIEKEASGLNKIAINGIISINSNGVASKIELDSSKSSSLESIKLIVNLFNSYLQESGYGLKLEKLKTE